MKEFADIFPRGLPSIPLDWQVEFLIDVVLGTVLILKAPYRMAPVEIKEMMVSYKSC